MSVFNCNKTYKRVEGDSYTSTYNKLISQGFIDKYLNVKVDVATWRKGRSELNEQASAKLGRTVNLFAEKKLLNGIRAVPDMKLFGMIDQVNKKISNFQPQVVRDNIDESIDEFGDSTTENLPSAETQNVYQRIYGAINQRVDSVIDQSQVSKVESIIENYNELNTGKVLSLRQITEGKYLINTEYKGNYLYQPLSEPLENLEEPLVVTDSNNNFNLPCIR